MLARFFLYLRETPYESYARRRGFRVPMGLCWCRDPYCATSIRLAQTTGQHEREEV
jgi:hypothetical protein